MEVLYSQQWEGLPGAMWVARLEGIGGKERVLPRFYSQLIFPELWFEPQTLEDVFRHLILFKWGSAPFS